MQKGTYTSQVLVTIAHDGRFDNVKGRSDLLDHTANRLWSMDGVRTVEAYQVGNTGEHFITLPLSRYNELLAAEGKITNV